MGRGVRDTEFFPLPAPPPPDCQLVTSICRLFRFGLVICLFFCLGSTCKCSRVVAWLSASGFFMQHKAREGQACFCRGSGSHSFASPPSSGPLRAHCTVCPAVLRGPWAASASWRVSGRRRWGPVCLLESAPRAPSDTFLEAGPPGQEADPSLAFRGPSTLRSPVAAPVRVPPTAVPGGPSLRVLRAPAGGSVWLV